MKHINSLNILKQELLKMCDCRIWDRKKNEWVLHDKFQKEYNVIKDFIDNQSLNLEDLYVGLWVWDNKNKIYTQILGFYTPTTIILRHGIKVEYEKNRFYLRQVK